MTTTHFIEANGVRLACDLLGDGPALVLLHGGHADRRMWADQLPAFAARCRVISYDLRGYGESSMPPGDFANHDDLAALLESLGVTRAALAGCSLGGKIAIDCALAYPALVSALVLVGAAPEGYDMDEVIDAYEAAIAAPIAAGDLDRAAGIHLQYFLAGPQRTLEQVDPAVRRRAHAMARHIFERITSNAAAGRPRPVEPPAVDRLAELRVPTLVIVGDQDLPELLASTDLLAEGIPGARKVVMPGVAHLPNMEQPDDFNRIVLGFLAALPA
jgi:pimeloyl-ACP methyl ester carboxylesterase